MAVDSGTCTIYCNNKGALIAAFGHKRPTPRWTCYDIVRKIRQATTISKIQWKHQHIKGHQDNSTAFQSLSHFAQGNFLADHFASQQTSSNHTITATSPRRRKIWSMTVNHKDITGNIHKRVKDALFKPAMSLRWMTTFGIDST